MTPDLWFLISTAMIPIFLNFPILSRRMKIPGAKEWAMGPRDEPFSFPPEVGRLERAQRNLLENLPTFAILVLVAHISGRANHLTAAGAGLFFAVRLVHPLAYEKALNPWRTVIFFIGQLGLLLIMSQILRGGF